MWEVVYGKGRQGTTQVCCEEMETSVCEEDGAVQCKVCRRWLWNSGEMAVNRRRRKEDLENDASGAAVVSLGHVECRKCGRTFNRQGGFKRRKCLHEESKPMQEQRGSAQWKK